MKSHEGVDLVLDPNRLFINDISDKIHEATWPWVLWRPAIYHEFDIVEGVDRVLIEGRFGKNLDQIYFHKLPIPRDVLTAEELAPILVSSFTRSFRSWRTEPENNIVLGEN